MNRAYVVTFAIGLIVALFGLIWALQGFGVLQGSAMSDTTTWSVAGHHIADRHCDRGFQLAEARTEIACGRPQISRSVSDVTMDSTASKTEREHATSTR